jgi:hypothetical protein
LEVDVQQGIFKILRLLLQVLILFLVEKWIPPSRPKTAQIGQKNRRNLGVNTRFQQKFATGSYRVRIWRAWCSRKACEICSSLVQKKKMRKKNSLHTSCPNSNRLVFGLKEF